MTGLIKQQCFINGKWVEADSQARFNVTNPATQEVITTVDDYLELKYMLMGGL